MTFGEGTLPPARALGLAMFGRKGPSRWTIAVQGGVSSCQQLRRWITLLRFVLNRTFSHCSPYSLLPTYGSRALFRSLQEERPDR